MLDRPLASARGQRIETGVRGREAAGSMLEGATVSDENILCIQQVTPGRIRIRREVNAVFNARSLLSSQSMGTVNEWPIA